MLGVLLSHTYISMLLLAVYEDVGFFALCTRLHSVERRLKKVDAGGNLEIMALLKMVADELDDVATKGGKPYINVV